MHKKHAYLVLAHQDFRLLDRLVGLLDDERNDIYIHIDKKVANLPLLVTKHSKICVLSNRIDARWGDYSLVEVELSLLEEAYKNGDYDYYHLISGVDLPIKSQDYIHDFCAVHNGKQFIGFADVLESEIDWRSQRYFIFSKSFKSKNAIIRFLRKSFLMIQDIIRYRRNDRIIKKGSQWCSITQDFVKYVLGNTEMIYTMFHNTYCPDEMFIQTLCWNSDFRNRVFDMSDEFLGCRRFIKWNNGELKPISVDDIPAMLESKAWFARKFSSLDNSLMEVYDREFVF